MQDLIQDTDSIELGSTFACYGESLGFFTRSSATYGRWTESAAEINQRSLPGTKVVKAFNIVGNPHMVHPDFPGGPPTMFICGNDEEAKKMLCTWNDVVAHEIVKDKKLFPFSFCLLIDFLRHPLSYILLPS